MENGAVGEDLELVINTVKEGYNTDTDIAINLHQRMVENIVQEQTLTQDLVIHIVVQV